MSNQYNNALIVDMVRCSKPFCVEDNARLYPFVVAGDAGARQKMIEGNMALAVAKVDSFIRISPDVAHLRDDLTSAAFIGLVKAVNKMATGEGPRNTNDAAPIDFIGMWINRELGELMESEGTIRLPARSKYRAQANGEELKAPVVCSDIPEGFQPAPYENEREIRDLIDACCESDEERMFVAMRAIGHTLAEIAAVIHTSIPTVSRLRRKLGARVDAKIKAIRNDEE